jgi:predicted metal-dependent hydrolase
MQKITVGNISIDVVRKDIKNLHLGVYPPNGRVRIASPLKIDDEAVRLFAISKMAWIKKQKLKFES